MLDIVFACVSSKFASFAVEHRMNELLHRGIAEVLDLRLPASRHRTAVDDMSALLSIVGCSNWSFVGDDMNLDTSEAILLFGVTKDDVPLLIRFFM